MGSCGAKDISPSPSPESEPINGDSKLKGNESTNEGENKHKLTTKTSHHRHANTAMVAPMVYPNRKRKHERALTHPHSPTYVGAAWSASRKVLSTLDSSPLATLDRLSTDVLLSYLTNRDHNLVVMSRSTTPNDDTPPHTRPTTADAAFFDVNRSAATIVPTRSLTPGPSFWQVGALAMSEFTPWQEHRRMSIANAEKGKHQRPSSSHGIKWKPNHHTSPAYRNVIDKVLQRASKHEYVAFKIRARGLKNVRVWGEVTALLHIFRYRTNLWEKVGRTETVRETANPQFNPLLIKLQDLCYGQTNRPIMIRCWDENNHSPKLIGSFKTSLDQIRASIGKQIPLRFNPNDTKEENSGYLIFDCVDLSFSISLSRSIRVIGLQQKDKIVMKQLARRSRKQPKSIGSVMERSTHINKFVYVQFSIEAGNLPKRRKFWNPNPFIEFYSHFGDKEVLVAKTEISPNTQHPNFPPLVVRLMSLYDNATTDYKKEFTIKCRSAITMKDVSKTVIVGTFTIKLRTLVKTKNKKMYLCNYLCADSSEHEKPFVQFKRTRTFLVLKSGKARNVAALVYTASGASRRRIAVNASSFKKQHVAETSMADHKYADSSQTTDNKSAVAVDSDEKKMQHISTDKHKQINSNGSDTSPALSTHSIQTTPSDIVLVQSNLVNLAKQPPNSSKFSFPHSPQPQHKKTHTRTLTDTSDAACVFGDPNLAAMLRQRTSTSAQMSVSNNINNNAPVIDDSKMNQLLNQIDNIDAINSNNFSNVLPPPARARTAVPAAPPAPISDLADELF